MKRLSVCIPVYNGEVYIGETIERVLKQSYQDFDLIVVDNASTDSTLEIVKKFKDSRIRLIENKENIGMAGNFNRCLEEAETEYIQILCADDIIEHTCLEEKVNFLNQHKDASLVFSSSIICDSEGKKIMSRKPMKKAGKMEGKKIIKKSFRRKNLYGEPSNVMFRKSAALLAGKFDEKMWYNIDWDYWLRLSLHGNVGYIDKELSGFRISDQSSTVSFLKKRKALIQNDKEFAKKCSENQEFELSRIDILSHIIVGRIRLYLKILFLLHKMQRNRISNK